MPAFNSNFNSKFRGEVACGTAIIGFKVTSGARGPAPHWEGKKDIIDETLHFFKPNSLMKKFEIKGPCDRTLLYLTFYVNQCLIRFAKKRCQNAKDAEKALFTLQNERIVTPGDRQFVLGGFFPQGQGREVTKWEQYIKQARQEIGHRLIPKVFGRTGKPDKFWMQFAKRKFLGKALERY